MDDNVNDEQSEYISGEDFNENDVNCDSEKDESASDLSDDFFSTWFKCRQHRR